jgi:RHS repeat-associated protein
LYFVKSGITLRGATHQVKRQNLTTTTVNTVVNNFGGDIRRTKHGEMLVATPAFLYPDEAFRIQSPNTASPSIVWGSFTGNDAKAEGALGLQPLVYELLPAISTRSLNQKRYELTDHLGNVRAVVSDRKLCDNSALPTPPTAYRAEVLNQTDFYPFGMISRSTMASGEEYRFSFQGQEKDDEIHGSPGTSLNYEFRMHDSRIGRFMSIDPLSGKFPHNSPYAFSENRVLDAIELEGLEAAQLKQHGQALWDAFTLSVSEACQPVIQLIDEHLVLEGRVTLSAGLAVEGKVNAGPLAKLEIKANAYSVTLAEGKADMTDPRNPASYTGSHVGDGGTTKVTQGIGITLKDNLTKQFGVEFDASHQWQTSSNNLSGQSDHQNTSAVTVGMELWNAKKAGPVPMSPAGAQSKGALEGKGSADPDACPGCMDFGAKLQVILGLEINLKIGVK